MFFYCKSIPPAFPLTRQLFGSTESPYVAVHLRLGGFEGEWKSIERFEQFIGLLSVLTCARDLAAVQGISGPILLLTDNAMLRDRIRAGFFTGFVTTPHAASHVLDPGHESEDGRRALMDSFLDLALLSRAR